MTPIIVTVPMTSSMTMSNTREAVIVVHWTRPDILEEEIVAGLAAAVVSTQVLGTVVILHSLLDKVQMNKQLRHIDATEDVLSVADNVLSISIGRHLQLEAATIVITAQRPEMCLMNSLHTL